jgi:hypothetical protein
VEGHLDAGAAGRGQHAGGAEWGASLVRQGQHNALPCERQRRLAGDRAGVHVGDLLLRRRLGEDQRHLLGRVSGDQNGQFAGARRDGWARRGRTSVEAQGVRVTMRRHREFDDARHYVTCEHDLGLLRERHRQVRHRTGRDSVEVAADRVLRDRRQARVAVVRGREPLVPRLAAVQAVVERGLRPQPQLDLGGRRVGLGSREAGWKLRHRRPRPVQLTDTGQVRGRRLAGYVHPGGAVPARQRDLLDGVPHGHRARMGGWIADLLVASQAGWRDVRPHWLRVDPDQRVVVDAAAECDVRPGVHWHHRRVRGRPGGQRRRRESRLIR